MSGLHWSFNASRPEQPEFGAQLLAAMGDCDEALEDDPGKEHLPEQREYKEFPNFWRGYRRDPEDLTVGSLTITRERGPSGLWTYRIVSRNRTSGEEQRMDFTTGDDPWLSLRGKWRTTVRNTAGDAYKGISLTGRIGRSGGGPQLWLTVNRTELSPTQLPPDQPVTADGCLFDLIPRLSSRLKETAPSSGFAVLELLRSPTGPCRLSPLESITLDAAGHLRGYCLFGQGRVPSYWWINEKGRVVLAATTFKTLVLSKVRRAGESLRDDRTGGP